MARVYNREHYRRHRDAQKLASRRYDRTNAERVAERKRAYYLRHREEFLARARARQVRVKDASAGVVSVEEIRKMLDSYGRACYVCGVPYEHLDHIVPLARGGAHAIENLAPLCARHNLSKGTKFLSEWLPSVLEQEGLEPSSLLLDLVGMS